MLGRRTHMLLEDQETSKRYRLLMNITSLKLSPQHSRLAIGKDEIRINYLKLNNKTYIFLSSKILSNSI